jgi:hypothetical protein
MRLGRWGSLVLIFVAVLGFCGIWILYPYPDSLRVKWIVVSLVIIGQCAAAGYMVNNRIDGILIDDRNRISLERFQWIVWLIVLLGGYFVECFANIAANQPFPTIQPQLLILLGIVSASPVVSNIITDTKKQLSVPAAPQANHPLSRADAPAQAGALDVNQQVSEASWSDLFLGEEVANRYVVDISRLQKLIITVLLVMAYVGWLWNDLTTKTTFTAMPQVDENGTFIWLLGISHAAYLAYKSTPKTPS